MQFDVESVDKGSLFSLSISVVFIGPGAQGCHASQNSRGAQLGKKSKQLTQFDIQYIAYSDTLAVLF